ncbi:hypothetical protein REPUB_Repub12eG0029900 [Reevesia pubescens]
MVKFQYEKLSDFCYTYDKLDHQQRDYDLAIHMKKVSGSLKREYGSWLKARGIKTWTSKRSNTVGRGNNHEFTRALED